MIVKMKKVTLLVLKKHSNAALSALRSLGVVHVKYMHSPHADYINTISRRIASIDKIKKALSEVKPARKIFEHKKLNLFIKEICGLIEKRQKYNLRLAELNEKLKWFQAQGDVSGSLIEELKESKVFLRLYICDKSYLKKIPKDKIFYVFKRDGSRTYIAYVSLSEADKLGLEEVEIPSENRHSLKKKISTVKLEIKHLNSRLKGFACYRQAILNYRKELDKTLDFCNVRFSMGENENILCLQGFCPEGDLKQIEALARKQGCAILSQEPAETEDVPVLIRNPRWVEIIRPVFKFMGAVPGYREPDVSFWFLIFLSLFFAMLIGDAGYGFIFLAITFFVRRKLPNADSKPFFLIYLMSLATIAWGAVTGTWFGAEKIAQLPGFNSLVITRVDAFVSGNQAFMIYLCFTIGVVHLSIAHAISLFRFINSLRALAEAGWICLVWAVYFLAGGLVLDKPIPEYAISLGVAGAGMVILFSNPRRNILKGAVSTLADLPLKVISSFSDIVSYLRLFAVGYATVAVAGSFNSLALSAGFKGIISGLGAALILLFGHTLNILLGLMAVIVHGIRLNMLEFSSHLNMEWSGKEYKPFSK